MPNRMVRIRSGGFVANEWGAGVDGAGVDVGDSERSVAGVIGVWIEAAIVDRKGREDGPAIGVSGVALNSGKGSFGRTASLSCTKK